MLTLSMLDPTMALRPASPTWSACSRNLSEKSKVLGCMDAGRRQLAALAIAEPEPVCLCWISVSSVIHAAFLAAIFHNLGMHTTSPWCTIGA